MAFATETTLDATKDLKLRGGQPTVNQNSLGLRVKDTSSGVTFSRTTLISFDASGITATDNCDSVVLKLTPSSALGSSGTMNVFELLQTSWTEGGATWNKYDGTNDWNTGGARGDGTDIDGDWTTTTDRLAFFTGTMTADVQISFTAESTFCTYVESKFGSGNIEIAIHATENEDRDFIFYDDEDATASNRPDLVINHSAAGAGGDRRVIRVD